MTGTSRPQYTGRRPVRLPDFPWDLLEPHAALARRHPDGVVDLSVGTPVDPVPEAVQRALRAAADTPGYPATYGTPALRAAAAGWLGRHGADVDPAAVLPTIGSKELVAWLPTLLGLGADSTVVVPTLAYPTYEVGARLAGAHVLRADATSAVGPARVDLVWVNSPSNPTGRVLGAAHLAKVVDFARERGAVVVSDECYLELGWSDDPEHAPVSVLDERVSGGDHTGLLAVHSLSKRSNLAGYRAGFVAGDPDLVRELLAVRRHAGMMVPEPVQAAMVAALSDDTHVEQQCERYRRRRAALRDALVRGGGFRVDHSEAGLYLWATRGEDCWQTVDTLARSGILVAPGSLYGPAGGQHVRVALTATDERVAAAVSRLGALA